MSETPYAVSARGYFPEWSPIPLPQKEKWPPPDGFTGANGVYVDGAQLDKWLKPRGRFQSGSVSSAPGNIGIRLPRNVIGIDVDAYGDKAGERTLEKAEQEWGELPLTYVSSARTDGLSGIRLYCIPEGLVWPGQLPQGGGVELIRWDHRYMVAPPSIHPSTSMAYAWYEEIDSEDGLVSWSPLGGGSIPVPEDLPDLPVEWVDGLTQGRAWKDRAIDGDMDSEGATAWLAERSAPMDLCSGMRRTLTEYTRLVRQASDDGGAHDSARDGAWAILGDAAQGHSGVSAALGRLRKVFTDAAAPRRSPGSEGERLAGDEWTRIVFRGVAKVSAEGEPEDQDPCTSITASRAKKSPDSAEAPTENLNPGRAFELNSQGDSDRLLRVMDGRARWVEGLGGWMLWNGSKWSPDESKQVDRWSVKAAHSVLEELAMLEADGANAATIKAFKAHHKSALRFAALQSTQNYAKARKGIIVPMREFDADPRLVNCANGTLVLGEDGSSFRSGHSPEDYLTLSTGVPYIKAARSELWDGYLDRFFPDLEIRDWLQKIVGYSLFGENPEQLMIVGLGGRSRGKSTLVESLYAALGKYAGVAESSLLRGGADDKPRPDLLKALPRRVVVAEELSDYQHLHADQIKRLTGAGKLSARGMRSNEFVERLPAFTPWVMTNEIPTIEGGDAALKDRLLVVPFTQFQQRDRASSRKRRSILASAEAIQAVLAWAVEGWDRYATGSEDIRSVPAGALEAMLEFNSQLSEFHTFLSDCCDTGDEFSERPQDLFEAYQNWCSVTDVPPRDRRSGTKFGRDLAKMGFAKIKVGNKGDQHWARVGIRLTDSARRIHG